MVIWEDVGNLSPCGSLVLKLDLLVEYKEKENIGGIQNNERRCEKFTTFGR